LGVDAVHLLDPTLLLDKSDYITLIKNANEPPSAGNLYTYILDSTFEESDIISFIATKLHLLPFSIMPKRFTRETQNSVEKCVFPPVTKWLRSFMDADFVVTDSFHGCVFSIIFNKPFVAIGNESRGMARFHSLLTLVGLGDRLITSYDDLLNIDWDASIDWEKVNKRLDEKRKESIDFLINTLV
jgi:exopolysaccharide biosynthesis predicted pyruvyltransferase EpsI